MTRRLWLQRKWNLILSLGYLVTLIDVVWDTIRCQEEGCSRFCSMHNVFTLFKNLHIEKVAAMMVSSQFIPLHFSITPRWHFSAGNPMKSFVKTIWTWLWQLQAVVSHRSRWLLIPLLKLCYIRWCMRKAPEIFRTENTRWDVYSLLTQKRYNII